MAGGESLKVLNAEPLDYSKKAIEMWCNKGFDYISSSWKEIDKASKYDEISILIIRLNRYLDKKVLDKFPNLKYLISATTGHDHIDLKILKERNIQLISLRGHNEFLKTIPSTAEHTWALLLSLIRKIPMANEHVRSGFWDRDLFKGFQLKGKTIGIIGLGRTGLKVAKYAKAFDMRIKYYDPSVNNLEYLKCGKIVDLLKSSDIISIHIHSNEDNKNFIDKEKIYSIKKGALVINTSRGSIWDENVFYKALLNDNIGGVATDVITTELNDIKKSPLWQAQQKGENIIITPHIGGATYDAMWACEEFIVDKFDEYL